MNYKIIILILIIFPICSTLANPWITDTDGDGLLDYIEVDTYNTNPNNPDTDSDSISDGDEVQNGTNPNDITDPNQSPVITSIASYTVSENITSTFTVTSTDINGDTPTYSLTGTDVTSLSIDPTSGEITFNTIPDYEVQSSYSITAEVSDGRGLSDTQAIIIGITDDRTEDFDQDGLTEAEEEDTYGTSDLLVDTDDDGLTDGEEVNTYGTDPLADADKDGDNLKDAYEVLISLTNPNNPDSDDDGLTDYEEVITHTTNPNNPDSDSDGISDGDEVTAGTNPNDITDPNQSPVITSII